MDTEASTISSDDPGFVAQLRAGDDAAFETLIRQQGGRMLAVAMRLLHNEDDARDSVQEAFLQAIRRIDQFESRARLSTWLHRIVVNAALMKLRQRQRHPEAALDDLLPQFNRFGGRAGREPEADLPSPEQVLEKNELQETVQTAIGKLPEIYRTVLLLRDIEEYDTATAAQMLGVNEGSVKTRLHRARAILKQMLQGADRQKDN